MRYYDATNPEARRYVWEMVNDGYRPYGVRAFWLDACEPEILADNPEDAQLPRRARARRSQGIYPREHARGFYEGLRASGEDEVAAALPLRLGGQPALRRRRVVGRHRVHFELWPPGPGRPQHGHRRDSVVDHRHRRVHGGDPTTAYFRELVVRWFQFGAFCPLFRLHGVREPGPLVGSGQTGAPNEVWSFGEEAYGVIREQLALRERIRPYVMDQMAAASATGLPLMRALFLEFPGEAPAWEVSDQYMFGPDVLVAPVTAQGARERNVYLPVGASWLDAWTGEPVENNGWVTADAPLERIPVYLREGGGLKDLSPTEHEDRGGHCGADTSSYRRRCGSFGP